MSILNVERIGTSGAHLVMLHGWGQTLSALRPLGELLSDRFQVHLIDLPGFGQSAQPDTVWNSFQYADLIAEYLNQQGIEQVHLLGHSFGGKVSISFAIRYPKKLNRLLLIAAAGLKRKRNFKVKSRLFSIKYAGKLVKSCDRLFNTTFFKDHFSTRFGSADYLRADPMMRSILVKSVNEDLSDQLKAINAPTLLLWGEEDQETPVETARRMNQLIPNSTLFLFPGKGHQLYHDCGAHLCASYIASFL